MEIKAIQVAKYFLSKDIYQDVFNDSDGRIRLNKYLHLSQNLYIAKTGKLLFKGTLCVNGNLYSLLSSNEDAHFTIDVVEFLDRVYVFLKNATIEELIELSLEDNHLIDSKSKLKYVDEYKIQYADALAVLDNISI